MAVLHQLIEQIAHQDQSNINAHHISHAAARKFHNKQDFQHVHQQHKRVDHQCGRHDVIHNYAQQPVSVNFLIVAMRLEITECQRQNYKPNYNIDVSQEMIQISIKKVHHRPDDCGNHRRQNTVQQRRSRHLPNPGNHRVGELPVVVFGEVGGQDNGGNYIEHPKPRLFKHLGTMKQQIRHPNQKIRRIIRYLVDFAEGNCCYKNYETKRQRIKPVYHVLHGQHRHNRKCTPNRSLHRKLLGRRFYRFQYFLYLNHSHQI